MDVPVEQHVEQVVHVPGVPLSAVDVVCAAKDCIFYGVCFASVLHR